jgi:hypothetical protein
MKFGIFALTLMLFFTRMSIADEAKCAISVNAVKKEKELFKFKQMIRNGLTYSVPKADVELIPLGSPTDFIAVDPLTKQEVYSFLIVTNQDTDDAFRSFFTLLRDNNKTSCNELKSFSNYTSFKRINRMYFDESAKFLKVEGALRFYDNKNASEYIYMLNDKVFAVMNVHK